MIMSVETCRKIKAIFVIAMMAVAEARHVQQDVLFTVGPNVRSSGSTSNPSNPDAIRAVPAEQAQRDTEQKEAITDSTSFQKQARRDAEQMEAKLLAEQLEAILADPSLHKLSRFLTEQIEVATAYPKLQEHARRLGEQLDAIMDNNGKLATKQIEVGSLADNLVNGLFDQALQRSSLVYHRGMSSPLQRVRAVPALPLSIEGDRRRNRLVPGVAALVAGLTVGARRHGCRAASGAGEVPMPTMGSKRMQLTDMFCNLFALWLGIAALAAIQVPSSFTWIPDEAFSLLLGLLMFSVGITTSVGDFQKCLTRPGAVAINFIFCYLIMPLLAYIIAKVMRADAAILAGLVLVGSINGGQSSNLCTLIAGGDVALSVLMTTSTTLGCIVMTPLICKTVLGHVVAVNAVGIVSSIFSVFFAPIFIGVAFNTFQPGITKAVAPYTPVAGVLSSVLLVGASVAKCAGTIKVAGIPLQLACLFLHLFGGMLGYISTQVLKCDERTCRTVAIETAMKSSSFGFLLAAQHFGAHNVRVPSAVSVVWMAITGSLMAVYWKGKPVAPSATNNGGSGREPVLKDAPIHDTDEGTGTETNSLADSPDREETQDGANNSDG